MSLEKLIFVKDWKFIYEQVQEVIKYSKGNVKIWDCGCGLGTTSLFLAMNNIQVHGTTIGEHYEKEIPKRKEYWSKYGNTEFFTVSYEALPYYMPQPSSYDAIVIQDTLHHMEPLGRST